MLFIFDDYTVDTQRETLSRAGQPIPLEPHALKLLVYLLQHHDRVVVRQELVDHLWPGRHGTAATLEQSIKVVRDALEDSASKIAQIVKMILTMQDSPIADQGARSCMGSLR